MLTPACKCFFQKHFNAGTRYVRQRTVSSAKNPLLSNFAKTMDQIWSPAMDKTTRLWLASAVSALAFHALIQHFELIELLVWQMLAAFSALGLAIFYADVQVFHTPPSGAAKNLAISATSFALTLTTSILIYRAFFHRLRKFPGPFAARLTKLWSVYNSSKNLQYHFVLDDVHKKYGDVVRTGMV